ncbi:MAG: roadblock/LC7 domain-containing protein [Blastocatellia bacterium]|nr:roadblock/LC7 domain-containing protein [Blastocatellia bacterium]MBL8192714.1 roadblock/LC7 domain-containing protein [Blastocatellia bacterium]MBN8724327.1 roadblock/LC7 domain-containing protein [Acidobacteriota bacterium]
MVFSELLKQIVNKVEGAVGVLIMGLDGIAIEQQIENTANYDGQLSIIAAAYATLLRNSMRTSSDVGVGSLQEMTVISGNLTLVIKLINPEYFLLVALGPNGNVGRARFELRKAQLLLEEEFAF